MRVHHISRWRSFDRSHFYLLGDLSFVAMSIETLQQQMADMALRQQQTDQMLQQTKGALQQSQQQAASPQSMSMVDTRLVGKPERWNGEDKILEDWRFVTRACLMGACPSMHDLLERRDGWCLGTLRQALSR